MTQDARSTPLLQVSGLRTVIGPGPQAAAPVADVSFSVHRGEILGIVGESGSGKTLTALSVVRMLPEAATVTAGEIDFDGTDLRRCSGAEMTSLRGRRIGMIFQDPLAYLNPRMTVGAQVAECALVHGVRAAHAWRRAGELLELVGIENALQRMKDYPHQFSGGMRQRVLIAMAMANDPELLIADEPTTALDVTVQAEILRLLVTLRDHHGVSVIIITHDMSIVRQICDTTMVMYGGRVVEHGPSLPTPAGPGVLDAPRHPYARALLDAVPRMDGAPRTRLRTIQGTPPDLRDLPAGCAFAPRCNRRQDDCLQATPGLQPVGPGREAACLHPIEEDLVHQNLPRSDEHRSIMAGRPTLVVEDITLRYPGATGRKHRELRPALSGVSLQVAPGQIVGVIGESGSGKSTLARAMLGLIHPQVGTVTVEGRNWPSANMRELQTMRRTVQMVFQDPYLSLNPRQTVRQVLAEPLRVHGIGTTQNRSTRLEQLMAHVSLSPAMLERLPHQLSGGQRQRVGIARALAVNPSIIVADEPVSALDVSVQAQIVNLLADLRDELGVGIVFIAHDLGLVRHCSDETYVMHRGVVVEHGPSTEIFAAPQHPYTKRLVDAAIGQHDLTARSG